MTDLPESLEVHWEVAWMGRAHLVMGEPHIRLINNEHVAFRRLTLCGHAYAFSLNRDDRNIFFRSVPSRGEDAWQRVTRLERLPMWGHPYVGMCKVCEKSALRIRLTSGFDLKSAF